MDALPLVIAAVYLIGMIAASSVYHRRCGLTDLKIEHGIDWREFLLRNLPFFVWMYIKILYWIVVLVVWLVLGLPRCPWQAKTNIDGRPARKIAWIGFRATESNQA